MLVVLDSGIVPEGLVSGIRIFIAFHSIGEAGEIEGGKLHERALSPLNDLAVPVAGLLLLAEVLEALCHIELCQAHIGTLRILVHIGLEGYKGFLVVLGKENLLGGIEEHRLLVTIDHGAVGDSLQICVVLLRRTLGLVDGFDGAEGILGILGRRHPGHNLLVVAEGLVILGLIGGNHSESDQGLCLVSRVAARTDNPVETFGGVGIAVCCHVGPSELIDGLAPETCRRGCLQDIGKQFDLAVHIARQRIGKAGLIIRIEVIGSAPLPACALV